MSSCFCLKRRRRSEKHYNFSAGRTSSTSSRRTPKSASCCCSRSFLLLSVVMVVTAVCSCLLIVALLPLPSVVHAMTRRPWTHLPSVRHTAPPRRGIPLLQLQRIRGGGNADDYLNDGVPSWSAYGNNNKSSKKKSADHDYSGDYYRQQDAAPKKDYYSSSSYRDDDGNYGDYYYDDKPSPNRRGRDNNNNSAGGGISSSLSSLGSISNVLQHGDRKVGLPMMVSGLMITFLGFTLFFNKTLLRLGNLLFIASVPLTIGPSRTASYFMKPGKIRATSCLVLGILLVFYGHPFLGILLEAFGLLNLFGNMFPFVMAVIKQMPIVGPIFKAMDGKNNGNNNNGNKKKKQRDDEYDDNSGYYDDYGGGGGDSGYGYEDERQQWEGWGTGDYRQSGGGKYKDD